MGRVPCYRDYGGGYRGESYRGEGNRESYRGDSYREREDGWRSENESR